MDSIKNVKYQSTESSSEVRLRAKAIIYTKLVAVSIITFINESESLFRDITFDENNAKFIFGFYGLLRLCPVKENYQWKSQESDVGYFDYGPQESKWKIG